MTEYLHCLQVALLWLIAGRLCKELFQLLCYGASLFFFAVAPLLYVFDILRK
jgi:hypothetical protein